MDLPSGPRAIVVEPLDVSWLYLIRAVAKESFVPARRTEILEGIPGEATVVGWLLGIPVIEEER